MGKIITPQRAARKITEDIIKHFRLPKKLCYPMMSTFVWMAIGVGYNIGRDQTKRSKPVVSLDDNGRIVNVYISLASAARDVGLKTYSPITNAIARNGKSAGYYWKLQNPNDHYVYKMYIR